jgi:hypothetical protein
VIWFITFLLAHFIWPLELVGFSWPMISWPMISKGSPGDAVGQAGTSMCPLARFSVVVIH